MPLYEYFWFIERVRRCMEDGMNRDTAVALAIKDCIREGIFAERKDTGFQSGGARRVDSQGPVLEWKRAMDKNRDI